MSKGYTNAEDSRTWLRKHLILSPEKIMEAAFASTGQRENSLWAAVRKLRFTASNFGQIIGAIRRKRYLTPQVPNTPKKYFKMSTKYIF